MIIYARAERSKRKVSKRRQQEYQQWLDSVSKTVLGVPGTPQARSKKSPVASLSPQSRRLTPNYPSLNTTFDPCFKKETPVYTGDKMKGIGTLHKSNAVPIFTDQEAKDQASMRR